MILGLALCALALLYLPALARPLGRRMPPQEWARIATGAILWGGVTMGLTLLALAAPTVLAAFGIGGLARLCDRLLGHLPHLAPTAGWGAAVLLAASLAAAARALVRARAALARLQVEAGIGEHVGMEGFELVILPTEAPVAYSRAGLPHQVVVSQGIVRTLTGAQIAMLLRHEHTHLAQGHERTLVALASLRRGLRWLPGLGASVAAARLSLERVADEEAAGDVPGRRRALAAALLATGMPGREGLAAFNAAEGLQERVRAMLAGFPPAPPGVARLLRGGATALRSGPAVLLGLLVVCLR